MTTFTTPNIGIKAGFQDAEDGWGDEMNYALRLLDATVQSRVLDKDLTAPPGSPSANDAYIVAPSATGAWSGHEGSIAVWGQGDDISSAWFFITPRSGWQTFVVDENLGYVFDGSTWTPDPRLQRIIDDAGTSHTFDVNDAGRKRRQTSSSAVSLTVPPEADLNFPIGTLLPVRAAGTGQVTLNEGSGVTFNVPTGFYAKSAFEGADIHAHKVGADNWDIGGQLSDTP